MGSTIVIGCLIFACIASLMNPVVGLVAFVANILIGIGVRYPHFSAIPIMDLIAVSTAVGWFLSKKRIGRSDVPFPEKHDKIFFAFLGTICLGLVLNSGLQVLINETKISFPILALMFFGSSRLISSIRSLRFFVTALIVIIIGLSVEGIFFPLSFVDLENIYEGSELAKAVEVPGQSQRFIGLGRFDNPNEVALIMNVAMPFLLLSLIERTNMLHSTIAGCSLIATSYLTIKTMSRAGFLGYISMLIFIVLLGKNKKRKIVLTVILVAGMLPLLSSSYLTRIGTISVSDRDQSAEGRITAWREGIAAIKWRPVLGLGKGNWKDYHQLQPHNSLILVTAETGLVGGFLWVMLIVLAFKKLIKTEKIELDETDDHKYLKRVGTALKIVLIGFLVTAFFGNQCYNPLLFVFMGLPHAMERIALDMSAVAKN